MIFDGTLHCYEIKNKEYQEIGDIIITSQNKKSAISKIKTYITSLNKNLNGGTLDLIATNLYEDFTKGRLNKKRFY